MTCHCLYSSNCVVNLAHDKLSVIKGAYNALKVSECVSVHTSVCMLVCVCVHVYMTNYSFANRMAVNYTSVMYMWIDQYLMN